MEVPEHEAFILHGRAIKTFADMARNLNPLSNEDFEGHRNNVIKWVEHSGKDKYLAAQLKEVKKDKFVELLAIRHDKELVKYENPKIDSVIHHKELKLVEKELEKLDNQINKPKNIEIPKQKKFFEFELEDFEKLIDEAKHDIDQKHYKEAVKIYETLKNKFEKSKFTPEQKKELHNKIKEVYHYLEKSLK